MNLALKTSHWLEEVEKEISLCSSNTIALVDLTKPNPDYNCLGIPEIPSRPRSPPSVPAKPPPPSRPPLPKSPAATPKHPHPLPRAGVISVTPELLGKVLSPTSGSPLKPAPPPPLPVGAGGSNMMHYDVPESPKRLECVAGGSSAIYEEIEDDVRGDWTGGIWIVY